MVRGAGVDIIEIARFGGVDSKQEFIREVLTDNEIQSVSIGPNQSASYATAFTIKEAVLKALGCGLHDGSYWHDVEIDANGSIRLTGHLASLARQQSISAIHSSQSRSENCVVAFVLLENENQEETP